MGNSCSCNNKERFKKNALECITESASADVHVEAGTTTTANLTGGDDGTPGKGEVAVTGEECESPLYHDVTAKATVSAATASALEVGRKLQSTASQSTPEDVSPLYHEGTAKATCQLWR